MPSAFFRASLLAPVAAAFSKAQKAATVPGLSAYVRQAVGQHIQFERPVISVRALGAALGGAKTVPTSGISLPPGDLRHWKRYAKAQGHHTVGALVNCALAYSFALWSATPGLANRQFSSLRVGVDSVSVTARIMGACVGDVLTFRRCTQFRRTHEALTSAQERIRRIRPGFSFTTRILPSNRVEVTRIA